MITPWTSILEAPAHKVSRKMWRSFLVLQRMTLLSKCLIFISNGISYGEVMDCPMLVVWHNVLNAFILQREHTRTKLLDLDLVPFSHS